MKMSKRLFCGTLLLAIAMAAHADVKQWGGGNSGPPSGGTVTSFSAGNATGLFTTSVSNPTTSPLLAFSLTSAPANYFWSGPCSGSAAAPAYRTLCANDIPAIPDTGIYLSTPLLGQSYQSGFNATVASDIFTLVSTTCQVTVTPGVGTYTFSLPTFVCINANSGSAPTQISGSVLQLTGADSTNTYEDFMAFGASPSLTFRRADGTNASKSAVQTGEVVGELAARPYGATTYATGSRAYVRLLAGQNQTDSAQGMGITFGTTPIGGTSTAEAARFAPSGHLLIGSTTDNSGVLQVTGAAGVTTNATAPPTAISGTVLQVTGVDGTAARILTDSFASGATFTGRRADTSNAAPSAVQSGEVIADFGARGYGATGYSAASRASVQETADENWSDTAQGTHIDFNVTANTTTTTSTKMRLNNDGGLQLASPTGGSQGSGTLNATGLFVNGTAVQTSATGKFVQTTIVSAGTTTFTTGSTTNKIHFRLQAAGAAGGGAASNAAGNGTVGGGGGAGGYCEKTVAVTPSTGYTTSLPTKGTGVSGATGGAPSGDSTIVIGATTYTAKAGIGGTTIATVASTAIALGAAATAVSTNCDVNSAGSSGGYGIILTAGSGGASGQGAASPFGAAAASRKSNGDGNACAGFGCGGAGALSGSGNGAQTGGNGGDSILVVDEYQ